jgi:hypothetical protein
MTEIISSKQDENIGKVGSGADIEISDDKYAEIMVMKDLIQSIKDLTRAIYHG